MAFISAATVGVRSTVLSTSSICGAKLSSNQVTSSKSVVRMEASPSVPFLPKPENLSDDMPGYAGFDPLGFSNMFNVKFLQEAEIKHCRICMLAALGMIVNEYFTFPFYAGAPKLAAVIHSWGVQQGSMNQLLFWISMFEVIIGVPAVIQMVSLDSPRKPGEFAFDPLGLGANPATYKRYQTAEIKNGRLAMIAIGGLLHQEFLTQMTPIQQILSGKFLP